MTMLYFYLIKIVLVDYADRVQEVHLVHDGQAGTRGKKVSLHIYILILGNFIIFINKIQLHDIK